MQQLKLINESGNMFRTICIENVKAVFNKIYDGVYEILLDINSNKFLININVTMDKIEQMEIVAVKGFVELSMKIVRIIKRIVYKLYFEV